MGRWTIEFPLPPRSAGPNYSGHWSTKRGKTGPNTIYKCLCWTLLKDAINKGLMPERFNTKIRIGLDFYLCRGRTAQDKFWLQDRYFPKDSDNARASFKQGQDAFALAGLVSSDHHRHVEAGETRLHSTAAEHKGRSCVVVTIDTKEAGDECD